MPITHLYYFCKPIEVVHENLDNAKQGGAHSPPTMNFYEIDGDHQ
jgi:hypothetical protein